MIEYTGAENIETPLKKKLELSEVQQAVASITCNGDTPSSEISATNPYVYILNCTNASTKTDQIESVEIETQTEVNLKVLVKAQASA